MGAVGTQGTRGRSRSGAAGRAVGGRQDRETHPRSFSMRCSIGAGRFRLQLDWFNEREGRARENSEILTQLNGLSCLVQADFFSSLVCILLHSEISFFSSSSIHLYSRLLLVHQSLLASPIPFTSAFSLAAGLLFFRCPEHTPEVSHIYHPTDLGIPSPPPADLVIFCLCGDKQCRVGH